MSDAQLSQDEIDALLDGVPPEAEQAPAWETRSGLGRNMPNGIGAVAGSFDVATAGRFNNGQLPTLALVNERFIEAFDRALYQFTGRHVTVTAEKPTVTKYAAFTNALATPSSLNIVRMGASLGHALFVFDSGLLYFVIDSLFGGSGTMTATKGGRHFTTTEQRLIGRLCEMVFTHYTKAWEPVHPMQFELVRSESETRFVNLAAPDDAVLAYGFTIASGSSQGRFQICMPLDGIDPIRDVIMRDVREKTDHDRHALERAPRHAGRRGRDRAGRESRVGPRHLQGTARDEDRRRHRPRHQGRASSPAPTASRCCAVATATPKVATRSGSRK